MLDPYFSATKIEWLLRNVDGLAERARDGRAVFGTVDSWLLFKLTGEHVTEPVERLAHAADGHRQGRAGTRSCSSSSAASPSARCPSCGRAAACSARTRADDFHGFEVPVSGVAGDQQAALFGQRCLEPGLGKNTYGTGSFVLANAGTLRAEGRGGAAGHDRLADRPQHDLRARGGDLRHRRRRAVAARRARDHLRGGARRRSSPRSLESNDGVYFVPALTGLGSPHWDPYARGTIVGLTRGSGRAHLARAALEAMAYQTVDAVRAMDRTGREPLAELRADGAATVNRWLMQFQADMLGIPVAVAEVAETTAFGAALLAGVGADLLTLSQVAELGDERARYEPRISDDERESLLDGWHRALERSRGWAREG